MRRRGQIAAERGSLAAPERQRDSFDRGSTQSQLDLDLFTHEPQGSRGGALGQRIFEAQTTVS